MSAPRPALTCHHFFSRDDRRMAGIRHQALIALLIVAVAPMAGALIAIAILVE